MQLKRPNLSLLYNNGRSKEKQLSNKRLLNKKKLSEKEILNENLLK